MTHHDQFLRGQVRPQSVNEKARTVELIASTGSWYERFDAQGPYMEALEITEAAIDLSRLEGMPLLDSHQQGGLDNVLGVVRGAKVEAGTLIVTVEFSERAAAIWKDVVAGIIRNVSVGYQVSRWADNQPGTDKMRRRTATRWTPLEISIVPVGADPAAKVRGTNVTTTPTTTPETPPALTRGQINVQIRAMAATMGLGADFTDPLIDADATLERAQAAAVIEAGKKRKDAPTAHSAIIIASNDDPTVVTSRMAEALYATRAAPGHKMDEAARPYVGMTLVDMARSILTMRSVIVTGRSTSEIVDLALRAAGMHTTSDFTNLLEGVGNRTLHGGYAAVPSVMKQLGRQTTAKDFRAKTSIKAATSMTLEAVPEGGEYKYGSFVEAKESYKLGTYGKIFSISRQAIINDDLGAFTDMAGKMGVEAALFESQFLVDLLQSNSGAGPTMDDGNALFHASHNNLAGSLAAPSEASLTGAWNGIKAQKGINGQMIAAKAKYALSSAYEFTFAQLLASITPNTVDDVNVFAGKLTALDEPRIAAARWYLVADPAQIPSLEYAYLLGNEGPQTDTRAGWEVDGVETKVRLDFGAGFVDWRGWYRGQ